MKELQEKICESCKKKYTPQGRNQKFCNKCRPTKAIRERYASKKYYWKNIEKCRQSKRESKRRIRKQLKEKIVNAFGGKCAKCGFTDIRALQIDHINGNGINDRKKFKNYSFYKYVLKNTHSGEYQLLCANCNWIKRYEKKEFGNKRKSSPNIKEE